MDAPGGPASPARHPPDPAAQGSQRPSRPMCSTVGLGPSWAGDRGSDLEPLHLSFLEGVPGVPVSRRPQ